MKVAILLLAAGRGTRFGGSVPKAYLPLAGVPLVQHAAERLARAVDLRAGHHLVLVAHPDDWATWLSPAWPALQALGDVRLAHGGDTRQQSMANGLAAADPDVELVLVHDAARALVPIAATRKCLAAAAAHGAALLALPANDTLKRVANGLVTTTVDRTGIWQAQTPQIVRKDLLLRAFAHAAATGFAGTDDVSLVEQLGAEVAVVEGSPYNLKVTHPPDLALAAAILGSGLLDQA
ncbi:MAG: 2-C-methyl-D-erythritol 4-phosphate cytidylyltransferase [Planctomycetes bacterium]|nr:2-C-methyl-D-erythritol 4-phosphate cytidylyltransferase [Planctomycetota bacterium]